MYLFSHSAVVALCCVLTKILAEVLVWWVLGYMDVLCHEMKQRTQARHTVSCTFELILVWIIVRERDQYCKEDYKIHLENANEVVAN